MFARSLILVALVVLGWAVFVRPLAAHGPRRTYVVKPHDTLWAIASTHYAGDTREAVWRIQRQNHVVAGALRPGETLVLP